MHTPCIFYKDALKEATNEIRKCKLNFEILNRTVSFFAHIIIKQKVKDMVDPLKDNDGIVITNGKEMADALNSYFSSMFTLEDKNDLHIRQPLLADNVECLKNMLM